MSQCDENDLLDDDLSSDLTHIQKELQRLKDVEHTLLERKNELESRKKKIRKEHQQSHQINIVEPDAFNMHHVNGKQTLPSYNAQASVDSSTQLIVAADVVQDRADFEQFSAQHQIINENIGSSPDRKYTADSGYHNLNQLEYIEENQIDAIMSDAHPEKRSLKEELPDIEKLKESQRPLERSDFIYDSQEDRYTCPSGRSLEFTRMGQRLKRPKRVYQSKDCTDCLLKRQCLSAKNKSGIRMIQRDLQEMLAEKMANKLTTQEAKNRLFVRKTTVEPVFGNLKENLGFRRFALLGLANVKNEFKLMAIAHNINKLYKYKEMFSNKLEQMIVNLLQVAPFQQVYVYL
jgi:transposase